MFSAGPTGVGVLNWEKCRERAKGRKKDWKLALETCIEPRGEHDYALRYYQTDIIRFNKDGSTIIDGGGWAYSPSTQIRINEHQGFIHLHNNTYWNKGYATTVRFGSNKRGTWSDNDNHGYPWPGKITIVPGKPIEGLADRITTWGVDPAKKKQRKEAAKQVRQKMVPRLVLGEFDAQVITREGDNFTYLRSPHYTGTQEIVRMFLDGAKHNDIAETMEKFFKEKACYVAWGRKHHYNVTEYPSRIDALRAFVNYLLRHSVLEGDKIAKTTVVEYPPVYL